MYYVYDEEGNYRALTDSLYWAKKMADSYRGWVKDFEGYIIYDYDDIFEYEFFY